MTSEMSPLVRVKASAARATTVSGGVVRDAAAGTAWCETKRAVEGCRARRSRTSSPSFLPWFGGSRWPRIVFGALVVRALR